MTEPRDIPPEAVDAAAVKVAGWLTEAGCGGVPGLSDGQLLRDSRAIALLVLGAALPLIPVHVPGQPVSLPGAGVAQPGGGWISGPSA